MFILPPNCIVPSATLADDESGISQSSILHLLAPFAANDDFNSEGDPVHQSSPARAFAQSRSAKPRRPSFNLRRQSQCISIASRRHRVYSLRRQSAIFGALP